MSAIAIPTHPERRPTPVLVFALALAVLLAAASFAVGASGVGRIRTTAAASAGVAAVSHGELPLYFVPNVGQAPAVFDFVVKGSGASLGFSRGGVAYGLDGETIRQSFVGGEGVTPLGVNGTPTTFSWFHRGESLTAPSFSALRYEDVWPGIDAVYGSVAGRLKYRFVVSPGADPGAIRVAYPGSSLALSAAGDLRVTSGDVTLSDRAPVSYQGRGNDQTEVASAYRVQGNTFTFEVGGYDHTRPLVIDPVALVYAGFLGTPGQSVAVGSDGSAYVAGSAPDWWPVIGGPDLTFNGDSNDAFIAKVNPAGTALVYAGFIGGSANDNGVGVAVNAAGNAFVAGSTSSTGSSFPAKGGPDLTHNGDHDAFVAKVNVSGTGLVYCGYIGGSGSDVAWDVALDATGNAFVSGLAGSTEATFPVAVGPDLTYNGGIQDAFVAKVNGSGTGLTYSGFVGGSGNEMGPRLVVDPTGSAYLAAGTNSTESSFPVAVGPDTTANGGTDAFVAKVTPSGGGLSYSGFIGGSDYDQALDIAIDGSGRAYVTGITGSAETTFPVAVGPDLTFNGGADAFVARVNADGSALDRSGYVGGSDADYGYGVALDGAGAAYLTGTAYSTQTSFPVSGGPDLTHNGGEDAFVAKVVPSGTQLAWAGFIGGAGAGESGRGIAVDALGDVFVTGQTTSNETTFPETVGPSLTGSGGYVAKLASERADAQIALGKGSFVGDGVYNDTGKSQVVTATVARGRVATFSLKFENDGGPVDDYSIQGAPGSAKFKATYLDGTTVVTADVVGGSYGVNAIAPGGAKGLALKVKVSKRARGSATFLVTATSQGDGSVSDVVKAIVKVT